MRRGSARVRRGTVGVRRGSFRGRRGSDRVQRGSEGRGVAQKGEAWLTQQRVGLLQGRHKFESRLRTPEEALYRAEAMRRSRVVLDEYYIQNFVCMLD